jgi:uncharacterized protein
MKLIFLAARATMESSFSPIPGIEPFMSVDHIRYDILAQEALRGMMRRVLIDAAKKGLPGEHHFFISFDTRAPGVRMSDRLRAQHPEEMTIVLQHQFWDLTIAEHAFEVGLSFNGVPERLLIPFDAIKEFVDPSVQFALKFDTVAEGAPASAAAAPPTAPANAAPAKAKPSPSALPQSLRKLPAGGNDDDPARAETTETAADSDAREDAPQSPPSGGAEVVRLDRFRKK